MGSDSDLEIVNECAKTLDGFGIPHEIDITSAHRAPRKTASFASGASGRGVKVIIAAAGGAAHLAGVIAAETTLPVIGVPIPSTSLQGRLAPFDCSDARRDSSRNSRHRKSRSD